jgi:hypothetical protein
MNKHAQLAIYILLPIIFASVHWIGVRVYAAYCAPPGFYGLMVSIFNTANPFCSYNLQMLEITKYFYNQAWVVIGLSSLGILNSFFKKNTGVSADTTTSSAQSSQFAI